jgi:hypothetical protein
MVVFVVVYQVIIFVIVGIFWAFLTHPRAAIQIVGFGFIPVRPFA